MPTRPNTIQSWRDAIKKAQSFRLPTRAELLHAGESAAIALDSMRREFQHDPVPFFAPALKPRAEAALAGDWRTALGPIAGPNDILMGAATRDPSRALIEARMSALRTAYGAPIAPAHPFIYDGYGESLFVPKGDAMFEIPYNSDGIRLANAKRAAENARVNVRQHKAVVPELGGQPRLNARLLQDLEKLPAPTRSSFLAAAARHPRLANAVTSIGPIEATGQGVLNVGSNGTLNLPMNTHISPPLLLHEFTHIAQDARNWMLTPRYQDRMSEALQERAREALNLARAAAEIEPFMRDQAYARAMTPKPPTAPFFETGYIAPEDLASSNPFIHDPSTLLIGGPRRGLLLPVARPQVDRRVSRFELPLDASLEWLRRYGAQL